MKFFVRRALAFLAWSPLLLMATNCASQGEGALCSQDNGNLDCDEGLQCKRVYVERYHYICCPVPPARVNVQTCNAAGVPPSDSGVTTPDARADGRADTSAPDGNGNDAVEEPTDDGSAIDATADASRDMSIDPSMRDISADLTADAQDAPSDVSSTPDQTSDAGDDGPSVDAPLPDTAPDVPIDVAGEASPDGPDLDVLTPIDVDASDAPAEGGPG